MYKRKSRFLTFIFSLLPGAGHMYLGLMKNGVSLMGVFFFITFLSSWLNIGPLVYVAPVIWFYAFFDCLNKSGMSEEEFVMYKDEYLFSLDSFTRVDKNIIKKRGKIIGGFLLIFGCYLLLQNLQSFIEPYLPPQIINTISSFIMFIPKVIVSIAIIALGINLILGKKKESEKHD